MNKRKNGTIKWFNWQKKFGFIVSDQENMEIFFHINDCVGFQPEEELTVEFEMGLDRTNRPKAMNIKVVSVGVRNGNDSNN